MPTVRLNDPATTWEYRVALVNVAGLFGSSVDVDHLGSYLNGPGSESWELVSVSDLNRGNGATSDLLMMLKRPLRG